MGSTDINKALKRHNRITMNLLGPFRWVRFVFTIGKDGSSMSQTPGPESGNRLLLLPGIYLDWISKRSSRAWSGFEHGKHRT